ATASLMLAMAITISCSSDKDEGGSGGGAIGSCTMDYGAALGSMCTEWTEGVSSSDAKAACAAPQTWSGGKCPSGAGLSCPVENDGVKATIHIYGAMAAQGSCDNLNEE
ncbi:MAG: hypothetical protein FWH22_07430, partial [Fibromonadales bacterium]|nr:hypothetical protein [Fibromonadales bacterium]